MEKVKSGVVSSFPRRREPSNSRSLAQSWIPVFTGMTFFFLVLQFTGSIPFISGSDSAAFAQDNWKQEFAEVCGKTQNAMELSPDQLRSYIDRCNDLESRIHELNGQKGSEKKVYATRLKMCKDLYVYTLEFREKEE
jgi:hypothetical protein